MTTKQWVEPVVLTGEAVELRPLCEDDVDALWEAGQDRAVWTWMPEAVHSRDQMRQWVASAVSAAGAGTEMPFAIRRLSDGQMVGSTRYLDISALHRAVEIGATWLSPEVWRTRVNTECKYLLLRHAFETVGAIRVQLKTDGRNERSQRAIERIGGVREGVLRRHRILWDGYIRDSVYYSILDEEWPEVKARLEAMLAR
jgi:RimJ/RimL family protein N-acetyltransferase